MTAWLPPACLKPSVTASLRQEDTSGYAASFQVVEVEPVYPVRFDRLDVPEGDLSAWLRKKDPFFGDKIAATEPVLRRHAAGVEEYLKSKGRPMKVIGKVVADAPDQFSIVFRPAAPEPAVAEVRFEGNTVIPSTILLNSFAGVAFGAPFREPSFRQMLDAGVRPLYDARGRVGVKFTAIRTEKAKTVDGLVVIVSVDEGPSYDLGDVSISGDLPLPAQELLGVGKFKSGEIVNFEEINAGVERIKKRLRREGYMHAALEIERKPNEKAKTLDLNIKTEAGAQYTFGRLKIEGLDIHGEAALKKLWTMKEGKPFNADYPEFFLNRVREDGVFDNLGRTKSVIEVHDDSHTVDVTLQFLK